MAPSSSVSDKFAQAVARLEKDPVDLTAFATVAASLRAQDKSKAGVVYEGLSSAARENGQAALALFAAKMVEQLGAKAEAKALIDHLVSTYAHGSARVDSALLPRPPASGKDTARVPAGASTANMVARAQAAVSAASAEAAQMAKLDVAVPAAPLLSTLDEVGFRELCKLALIEMRPAGDVVIETGQEAYALYLVAHGSLSVHRGEHDLGILHRGTCFGEIALLGGTSRTATVRCTEATWLVVIPHNALEAAAERAPKMADTLAGYARRRLLNNVMRTSEIFRRLDPTEKETLRGRFELRVFDSGETVVEQGDEGGGLHVIISGQGRVMRDKEEVAHLDVGDVFGEMSLIGRKPANASIVAQTHLVAFALARANFDSVAVKHPTLLSEVYKILVEREQDLHSSWLEVEDDAIVF